MYHPEQRLTQYMCPRHGISHCDECPHREIDVDEQAFQDLMAAANNSLKDRINNAIRLLVDSGYEVSHPVSLRPEQNGALGPAEEPPKRNPGSPRFLELLGDMRRTHIAKNAGYAGADNPDFFANFRDCEGINIPAFMGCLVRMGDKWSRIKSLARDPSNERVGEAITDTLIDLANYSLIAICLYEEQCRAAEKPAESEFQGILSGMPGVVRG